MNSNDQTTAYIKTPLGIAKIVGDENGVSEISVLDEGTVSVRHRDNENLVTKSLEEFLADITAEIKERRL